MHINISITRKTFFSSSVTMFFLSNQGPLQQMNKLKHAVSLQTDPVSAAMIQQSNISSSSSTSQLLDGSELAGGTMM